MTEKWDLSRKDVVDSLPVDRNRLFPDLRQDGLYVRVQDGKKTWAPRCTVGGVQRQISLPISQPYRAARDLARELRLEARRGRDIVAERRAAAETAREAKARSLGTIVEAYLADAPRRLRPESLRLAKIYLQGHWRSLHHRPADELTRREIVVVLEGYAGRPTAKQLWCFLSMALGWGVERGLLERNAAMGIKAPAVAVARDRVFSEVELRIVLVALDGPCAEGAARVFRVILRFILLTACRRSEAGNAQWSEIDLDRAVWTIPAERSKNARLHALPLSRQAVVILRAMPVTGAHVFGGTRGFMSWTRCHSEFAKPLGLQRWVMHDLRRSVATHMADLGIAPHVVEGVLGHAGHRSGVGGVYNRGTYAAEQRAALQRWADHLDVIAAGETRSNVVGFAR